MQTLGGRCHPKTFAFFVHPFTIISFTIFIPIISLEIFKITSLRRVTFHPSKNGAICKGCLLNKNIKKYYNVRALKYEQQYLSGLQH